MPIQGNGSVLKGIFYDYHHDHDFHYDYHSVKKRYVDVVQSRFRLNDNERGNIKSHSVSIIHGVEQSDYEIQCGKQIWGTMKHDDSYFENMTFNQNCFAKSPFSDKNALEEILPRIQRDALYDPTIETDHVNDFNFRYYPNGFHYIGKLPRTYEFPEYIHRCYHGDRDVVCVFLSDKNYKYDFSNHKLDYISENKLRWFII